jgi:hypothetical protein
MKFLEQFRQTAAEARKNAQAEVDKIGAEIEAFKRERDIVLSLPLPKSEIIADYETALDALQAEWIGRFRHRICDDRPIGAKALLAPNSRPVADMPFPPLLGLPSVTTEYRNGAMPPESPPPDHVDLTCLLGLLATPLKPIVRSCLEAMDWPAKVGLPRDKRKVKVTELDQKIRALEGKRLAIIQAAREAGIAL